MKQLLQYLFSKLFWTFYIAVSLLSMLPQCGRRMSFEHCLKTDFRLALSVYPFFRDYPHFRSMLYLSLLVWLWTWNEFRLSGAEDRRHVYFRRMFSVCSKVLPWRIQELAVSVLLYLHRRFRKRSNYKMAYLILRINKPSWAFGSWNKPLMLFITLAHVGRHDCLSWSYES